MKTPEVIKSTARELRKNMTDAERILWKYIRRDVSWSRFLRQKPLYVYTENSWLDRFIIPDFYCHEKKLIIEVDGSIHNTPEIYFLDREKELLLISQGIYVLRFQNEEIFNNIEKVIQDIKNTLVWANVASCLLQR
jgi:cyclase